MGLEVQNSFKEGPKGDQYGKVTVRHQGFRKYVSPNQPKGPPEKAGGLIFM